MYRFSFAKEFEGSCYLSHIVTFLPVEPSHYRRYPCWLWWKLLYVGHNNYCYVFSIRCPCTQWRNKEWDMKNSMFSANHLRLIPPSDRNNPSWLSRNWLFTDKIDYMSCKLFSGMDCFNICYFLHIRQYYVDFVQKELNKICNLFMVYNSLCGLCISLVLSS